MSERKNYKEAILKTLANGNVFSTRALFAEINKDGILSYGTFKVCLSQLNQEHLIYNVHFGYWKQSRFDWYNFETIAPCNKKSLL